MAANKTPVKSYVRTEVLCRFCGNQAIENHCINIFGASSKKRGFMQLLEVLAILGPDDPPDMSKLCCNKCQTVLTHSVDFIRKANHTRDSLKGFTKAQKRMHNSPQSTSDVIPDTEALRPTVKRRLLPMLSLRDNLEPDSGKEPSHPPT